MDFSLGKGTNELVLDCSSSNIKLAVGSYNSKTGNVTIEKMGVVPLEGDAINDGAVSDSFGVVMALKHAIARLDIRMKSCIITTEGAFVHTRDLELPVVKEDQLKDMVKYEILGQGSNRDMSIDYLVYGTTKDEETNADKIQVRATAVPTDIIKDYREFLKNMDLNPVALDINPNAVRKLFETGIINGNVNIKQSTILLIDLGSKTTTVTVLDKGFPVLSRRLQFGHANIRRLQTPSKSFRAAASSHLLQEDLILQRQILKPVFRSKILTYGMRQLPRLRLFRVLLMHILRAWLMQYHVQLSSRSQSITLMRSAHVSFMVLVPDIRRSIKSSHVNLELRLRFLSLSAQ